MRNRGHFERQNELFQAALLATQKPIDKLKREPEKQQYVTGIRNIFLNPGRAEALPGVGSVEYGGAEQHDLRRKQIPPHLLRESECFPFTKGRRRGRGGRIRFLTASRFLHRPALCGGLFAMPETG